MTNLFCLYPAQWVDAYIFTFDYSKTKKKKKEEKTGRAETAEIFAANVWSEMLIPVKFRNLTKGSKECSPAPSSQKLERRRQHWLWKGTRRKENTHISSMENGAGAANWRLRILFSLLFPHLFWLASGTRNPTDVTCPGEHCCDSLLKTTTNPKSRQTAQQSGDGRGSSRRTAAWTAGLRLAGYCFLPHRLLLLTSQIPNRLLAFFVSGIRAEQQVTEQTHAGQNRCKKIKQQVF